MERWKEKPQPVPILLYVPALHNGYLEFFKRHSAVSGPLWLIGADLAAEHCTLHTEIRALDPNDVKKMIGALNIFKRIEVLDRQNIGAFNATKIITASELVSKGATQKYFPDAEVIVDSVFLRYDESNVKTLKSVVYDRLSEDTFDLKMMALAYNEADKSSCWWRHVGSVLVKHREIIAVNHNEHVPSEQMPYILGDPRDFIEAGKLSHFASSLHGEKMNFLQAMRQGVSTEGADIYVSVFPCPDCAKMIAYSGIKRCFFGSGHASLRGQEDMKSQGVELVYVSIQPRAS